MSQTPAVNPLPDAGVFYYGCADTENSAFGIPMRTGWYWWACFPCCRPEGNPHGPFDTEALAIADVPKGGAECQQ